MSSIRWERPKSSRPGFLEGGLFNTTYLVALKEARRRLVLRAGPVNTHLLLPFERRLMHTEQDVCRLFEQHGIPASHVLACDTSRRVLDRDYMIVDYIQSVPLSDPSIPEEKKEALYLEAGRYKARMHRIDGQSFGRAADVTGGRGNSSWLAFLMKEIQELEQASLAHGVMTHDETDLLRAVFTQRSALFEGVRSPKLVHADLWDGNILVRKEGEEYRIAAMIDADRALFGDPDFDLSCPWMTNPAFFEGLGVGRLPTDGPRGEKMDAYVWAVGYNNLDNYNHSKQKVFKISRRLLGIAAC